MKSPHPGIAGVPCLVRFRVVPAIPVPPLESLRTAPEILKLPVAQLGRTVMVAEVVLLAGLGSICVLETAAVLILAPTVTALAVIVTVALAPLAKLPKLHVTVPLQVPWVVAVDTQLKPTGKVLVRVVTLVAEGPLFLTVTV